MTMQSAAIDAMLAAAQIAHARGLKEPHLEAKFSGFVLRQLTRNFGFSQSIAELVLLNYVPAAIPPMLSDEQMDKSAAMIAANIHREFNAMVDAGFGKTQTDALCAYVGRAVSAHR